MTSSFTMLLVSAVGFAPTLHPRVSRSAQSRAASQPGMVLGLPSPPGLGAWPFGAASKGPERLREGDAWIDYEMESIGLTKRRVSGGITVEASAESIWRVLTAYEQLPDVVPNIIRNEVTRRPDGSVSIAQSSLLSRRLDLKTDMTLEVEADDAARKLVLRRVSGHGFLEFVGSYTLKPQPGGTTYLQYNVELVPCPIFPIPLVETKIRKEVPKMLQAVRLASLRTM